MRDASYAIESFKTLLILSEHVLDQLMELVKSYDISLTPINTRCPRCNGSLKPIEKKLVEGRVPPESFRAFTDFWICRECEAVYWKGSHWAQIEETLENIASSKSL